LEKNIDAADSSDNIDSIEITIDVFTALGHSIYNEKFLLLCLLQSIFATWALPPASKKKSNRFKILNLKKNYENKRQHIFIFLN